ncbi:MAG: hypothetical protein HKN47_20655 [Pirellulaceae bacterium]|nr:hypothetical protein [Pirellulaceae bacterium]
MKIFFGPDCRNSFDCGTKVAILAIAIYALIATPIASAKNPSRIWVDATGRYSVEAALVEHTDEKVVLVRQDGGKLTMPLDGLSKKDREYVEQYDRKEAERAANAVQRIPTGQPTSLEPPELTPQKRLDLPATDVELADGAELLLGVVTATTADSSLPLPLIADPAPDQIRFSETTIPMEQLGSQHKCSELLSVGTQQQPAIGMSINVGFTLARSSQINRLVKFDPITNESQTIYKSEDSITLLDHHTHSGRSLVLIDHDVRGRGGRLAMATGWRDNEIALHHQRNLPATEDHRETPEIRWARWIDEEHFVAAMGESLIGWNLVSGETYLRIDGIHKKAIPAISPGRHYLALPGQGAVHLFRTTDGKSLGRIPVESRSLPGVRFSRHGHALAIGNALAMRTWDLTTAVQSSHVTSRQSLGSGAPTWIDFDLVMSSSGTVISIHRGLPVWRYHLTGTTASPLGERVAIFRKYPETSMAVIQMPHEGATQAIQWIDQRQATVDPRDWKLPGRSVWSNDHWTDRDVRISRDDSNLR